MRRPGNVSGKQTTEELLAEIKELEKAQALQEEGAVAEAQEEEQEAEQPTSAEEEVWKKRHGDLRRHTQSKENEANEKIKELTDTVKALKETKQSVDLPRTSEEMAAFQETAPDVYAAIETMVLKGQGKLREELEEGQESLRKEQSKLIISTRKLKVKESHPDMDEVNDSDEFKTWLKSKAGKIKVAIEDTLFGNDSEAEDIVLVLNDFKKEVAWKAPKKRGRPRKEEEAAASATKSGRLPAEPSGGSDKIYKESQIHKMDAKDYKVLEAEIDEAIRDGRFIYDMTGRG